MFNQFMLSFIEQALQQYLALDPKSVERLSSLNHKAVKLVIKPIDFSFVLKIENAHIFVLALEDEHVNATITGTPLQLAGVMASRKDRHHFFASDVSISGEASCAKEIMDLFDELDIDFEELLSQRIGDVPAHHLSRMTEKSIRMLKEVKDRFLQNTNEYLHEEVNYFPSPHALSDFYDDVDQLRMDTDRLAARIQHLANTCLQSKGDV